MGVGCCVDAFQRQVFVVCARWLLLVLFFVVFVVICSHFCETYDQLYFVLICFSIIVVACRDVQRVAMDGSNNLFVVDDWHVFVRLPRQECRAVYRLRHRSGPGARVVQLELHSVCAQRCEEYFLKVSQRLKLFDYLNLKTDFFSFPSI